MPQRMWILLSRYPWLRTVFLSVFVVPLVTAPACFASAQTGQPSAPIDPTALVRRASQHRLDERANHRPLRYLVRKIDERHDTTKEIIETKAGNVARLIAVNGKPLSAQANQAELARLHNLANHPELQEHRKKREQQDEERVDRLMRLLPDAFLYRFEGMTPCAASQCYKLSFSPNPQFHPPDQEARIFLGMAGEVLIDQAQERLTRIDVHLISDVEFGWGIIGTLDKGGTILMEQADIGGGDWEVTRMELNLRGKLLMVKSVNLNMTQVASHFSLAPPDPDYRQAIQILESDQNAMIGR